MNAITANALLKTLEEPPGDVRFVLACEAVHQLLPTIRSRCLGHAMTWPQTDAALAWLKTCGVDASDAPVWLRASGGRPDDALALAQTGAPAKLWGELPRMVAKGDPRGLADLSLPQVVSVLQKLCHDLMAVQAGAEPRFFDPKDLPTAPKLDVLSEWSVALARSARTAEHPFNPGLMLESLTSQACNTLQNLPNIPRPQAKSRLAPAGI
jgi:DNA polymerase-3 subunit delta'